MCVIKGQADGRSGDTAEQGGLSPADRGSAEAGMGRGGSSKLEEKGQLREKEGNDLLLISCQHIYVIG